MWQAADYLTRGGVEYAQKLLVKTLGPEMARRVLDRVVKSFESTMAFNALEKADPQQLSKFILTEHPQTIALILAHLKPAQAVAAAELAARGPARRRHHAHGEPRRDLAGGDHAHLVGHRAAPEVARRRRPTSRTAACARWPSC